MRVQKQIVMKLNLFKQNLFHSPTANSKDEALSILQKLGCIQLDTLNVISRSHNLVLLARMNQYKEEWYWEFYKEKKIVEGYVHALSILPVDEYIYLTPSQKIFEKYMLKLDIQKINLLFEIYDKIKKNAPI